MSDTAGTQPQLTSRETARLNCAANREYTKAVLFLACIAGGALIVIGKWQLLIAGIIGGVAVMVARTLFERWRHTDLIRKMDENLPKISFDKEEV